MSSGTRTVGLAQRLSSYCSAYRLTLLQHYSPSRERNQCLRAAQRVQSRLYHCSEQQADALPLGQREIHLLQAVIVGLLHHQCSMQPGKQHEALVAELVEALLLLRRTRNPSQHL